MTKKKTDIRSFAVNPTAELHLRGADEELLYLEYDENGKGVEETAVKVVLFGPGSQQYRRAQQKINNQSMNMLRQKGKVDKTPEEAAKENAEYLASLTQSWQNMHYDELEGHELSMAVYQDTDIGFIGDQVAKFVGDWANFSKPSAKN